MTKMLSLQGGFALLTPLPGALPLAAYASEAEPPLLHITTLTTDLAYVISEENFSNCCTAALAVYLLLFSVSYYLHSPGTASGACYRRRACIDMEHGHVEACGSGLLRHACGISRCVGEFRPRRVGFLLLSDD